MYSHIRRMRERVCVCTGSDYDNRHGHDNVDRNDDSGADDDDDDNNNNNGLDDAGLVTESSNHFWRRPLRKRILLSASC